MDPSLAFAPHMFAFNFAPQPSDPASSYDTHPQHDYYRHHHQYSSSDPASQYLGTSTPTSSIDTPVDDAHLSHPMIAGEHYDPFQPDYSPLRGHYTSNSNWMPSDHWDNPGIHPYMASKPDPMGGFDPASAPQPYAPERHHPCAFGGGSQGAGPGVCGPPAHHLAQQQHASNYAAQMAYASGANAMQHSAHECQPRSVPSSANTLRQDQETTMTVTISVKTQLSPPYAPHHIVPSQSQSQYPSHAHAHAHSDPNSNPNPHSHSHSHVPPAYHHHPQQQQPFHQHPSSYHNNHNQIQYALPHLPQHHAHPHLQSQSHPHSQSQMRAQMTVPSQGGLPASVPTSTFVPTPAAYQPHPSLAQIPNAHVPLHQPRPVHPPPEWTKIPSPTVEELFPLETLGMHPAQEGAAWGAPVEHARIEELPEEEEEEEEDMEDDEEEEEEEEEDDEDVEMEESDEEDEEDEEEYYEAAEPPQDSPHTFHFGSHQHPSHQQPYTPDPQPAPKPAQGTLSSTSLLCQPISAAVRDQFRVPHTQAPSSTSGAQAYSWT